MGDDKYSFSSRLTSHINLIKNHLPASTEWVAGPFYWEGPVTSWPWNRHCPLGQACEDRGRLKEWGRGREENWKEKELLLSDCVCDGTWTISDLYGYYLSCKLVFISLQDLIVICFSTVCNVGIDVWVKERERDCVCAHKCGRGCGCAWIFVCVLVCMWVCVCVDMCVFVTMYMSVCVRGYYFKHLLLYGYYLSRKLVFISLQDLIVICFSTVCNVGIDVWVKERERLCVCTQVWAWLWMCMNICMRACVYVSVCVCRYVCVCDYVHECMCAWILF